MDDLRLDRALRAGPPFRTGYVARPLSLETGPATHRRASRPALRVLAVILLLAALAGAVAVGSRLIQRPVVVPAVIDPSVPPTVESSPTPPSPTPPSPTPEATPAGGGHFVPTGPLGVARSQHASTLLQDGRVLVAGGEGPHEPHASNYLHATEVWDPTTGSFNAAGGLRDGDDLRHVLPNLLALPDGRVLVIPAGCACRPHPVWPAEIWDPATRTAHETAFEIKRGGHTSTRLIDGRILIAGGNPSLVAASTAAAEVWDPARGEVTPSGPMISPRFLASATVLADGRVLVVGGLVSLAGGPGDPAAPSPAAEIWDPSTASFSPVPSLEGVGTVRMIGDRIVHLGGAIALHDGRVLLLDESGARIWDPVSAGIASAGAFLEPRIDYTATVLRDGRILVVGGEAFIADAIGSRLRTAELWDPVTETFTSAGTLAEPRLRHTVTALADGRALVVGGVGLGSEFPNADPLASAEIWEPGNVR